MINFKTATFYGVVQGATEFLPVSSSGHLVFLPHLLKIPDPGLSFDLAMHIGTTLAIIIYFRRQLRSLLRGLAEDYKTGQGAWATNLLVATMGTAGMGIFFRSYVENRQYFRNPLSVGILMIVFGALMWYTDRKGKVKPPGVFSTLELPKSLLVGVCMGFAVFPGVSRAGSSMTALRALGVSRVEGTHFSFLLAVPVIIGGFILNLPHFVNQVPVADLPMVLYGILVSTATGLFTIHFFLSFVNRFGLGPYAIYRFVVGSFMIYWHFSHLT